MAEISENQLAGSKILIVDDEEDILELLTYNFEKDGYTVFRATNGEEALRMAPEVKPDLILLDIMMPKMDGVAACQELRKIPQLSETSIVFITARSEEYSELAGFEAGADDYIIKPIKPRVLRSRVKALLRRRRQPTQNQNQITIHDLEILRDEYLVKKNGEVITLTRKEFELLFFLASRPGKVFRREDLLSRIWENVHVTDRTVDVHIRKLREKTGPDYIITVKGVGYKFRPEEEGV